MNIRDLIGPQLDRLQRMAGLAALIGGVMSAAGLALSWSDARQWFAGYLVAFMFWMGVTMGSLAWLMIGHVTGGGWAIILRRLLEASVRNIPVVFAMFVPILIAVWLGASNNNPFFAWTNTHATSVTKEFHSPESLREFQHVVAFKSPWLNPTAFTIRAIIYFVLWGGFGGALVRWSRAQNTSNDAGLSRKLNTRSAFGLLVYALTMTFASIDWVMSLTPTWYSSLFGVVFVAGQGLGTLALMTVLINALARDTKVVQNIEPRYIRDLGNLMLAFTLLWGYTNISQFMLMWSGNLPEEVSWYTVRTLWENGWIWVGVLLIVGHFWIPLFCFLSSALKVRIQNLSKLGLWIVLMRFVDLHYYIAPTFRDKHFTFQYALSDVGLPLCLGGIWLFCWAAQLRNEQLVPMADPRVQSAMSDIQHVLGTAPTGGAVSHG